eukprot:14661263-Alexandrium_andersonii.AAC.1
MARLPLTAMRGHPLEVFGSGGPRVNRVGQGTAQDTRCWQNGRTWNRDVVTSCLAQGRRRRQRQHAHGLRQHWQPSERACTAPQPGDTRANNFRIE